MTAVLDKSKMTFTEQDAERIRQDFPVLAKTVYGKPLAYLDNGATTQKPKAVIEAMNRFYSEQYGTVRRGVYKLSEESTRLFDETRTLVSRFINSATPSEIVFTKGTTEAINLVAASFARPRLNPGDEIIISAIEHHANIVPWQQVCIEKGAVLKIIPVSDQGELDMAAYETLLSDKTRLVAVNHVSNALGTINPVERIIELAHAKDVPVLIDGAQSAPHMTIDVQALDCDFYAFSGHKIYGPTGIGVLYGKMKLLEQMPPYQTGGDMIVSVSFEKTTFAKPPQRFEAGTPAIAEVIGLGAALKYLSDIGMDAIEAYELELLDYATKKLQEIPEVRIIGQAKNKGAIISFVLEGVHPHDIGTILDREGIAIRAGHHCAQPTMERYGVPATARASFSFYNTKADADALVVAVKKVLEVFK